MAAAFQRLSASFACAVCCLCIATPTTAGAVLERRTIQVVSMEPASKPVVDVFSTKIALQLSSVPKALQSRRFSVRMYPYPKDHMLSWAGTLAVVQGCVRLGGFQRYPAHTNAAGRLIVDTGTIPVESLSPARARWEDRVWTLVAEIGDVGDSDGIWLEAATTLKLYVASGIEITISAAKAPPGLSHNQPPPPSRDGSLHRFTWLATIQLTRRHPFSCSSRSATRASP